MPNRWTRDANNVLVPKIPVGGLPDGSVVSADIAENTIVDADIASGAFPSITGIGVLATDLVFADAVDIILDTTIGTKIGTATTQKLGFYNATPVVQQTALTAVDATAIDGTYDSVEQAVLNNVRTRVNDMETKLQALGFLA